MNLKFLRNLDRWIGPGLLQILGPTLRILQSVFVMPAPLSLQAVQGKIIFLKLKGGGSLVVALPALLGIRKAAPQARLALICTPDTKVYADLLGIFDEYCLINDHSIFSMLTSGMLALIKSRRAALCIDLEVNSILAAVFAILTMSARRIGFVRPEEKYRHLAYTDALAFNVYAPIYLYYDQLAKLLGADIASIEACRERISRSAIANPTSSTLGICAFTSEFAQERMMPVEVWEQLLRQNCPDNMTHIKIFGSAKNKPRADLFAAHLTKAFPKFTLINMCGCHTMDAALQDIATCHSFWSVDSGLLHIARLLGVPCRSFWGPTDPAQRLRPIDGLNETTHYLDFICSPCVHVRDGPPCKGDNQCMKSMANPNPQTAPIWHIENY